MKKHIIILALIFAANFATGQIELGQKAALEAGPQFYVDTATLVNPTQENMLHFNLYMETAYDELLFLKKDDGFQADYEFSVVIYDKDKDQVSGKIWKETVSVQDYNLTNSQSLYSFTHNQFNLEPGKYTIAIALENLESQKTTKQELKVKLDKIKHDKLSVSDIILADQVLADSVGILSISPLVSNPHKGVQGDLYLYFEIYNPKDEPEVTIEYMIVGKRSRARIKGDYKKELSSERTLDAIKIPTDSLTADEYRLELVLKGDKDKAKTEKTFWVNWQGMPSRISDLDKAIAQVEYISTRNEWKRFKKAKDEEKLEIFQQFWTAHDPTPGTELNEAMEAHYSRIEMANQTFSAMNREGWKTDMGMIYVLLGGPDEVERNVFPRYSRYPYEIWQYYRYNRYFEFYDPTGFGDYRLATPFSIYEAQRLLTR